MSEDAAPENLASPGGVAEKSIRPTVLVEDLRKEYGGFRALRGISFELYPGDILGFLGPNGSGKTTALRILSTVLKPTSGTATVCDYSIEEVEEVRMKIGYMPDFIGSYDELTVDEYMEFFARAYLVPADQRAYAKQEALAATGLTELVPRPVRGLSRGQSQRLALARLLMHDPPVLFLDEPAAGLDPRARVELRDILKELQKRQKTIIISSHVLEDLADVSNKIAVIEQGKLLAFGKTKDLLKNLTQSRKWTLRLRDPAHNERLREALLKREHVEDVALEDDALKLTFSGDEDAVADLHQSIVQEGFRLTEFAEKSLGLEELYMRITGVAQS